MRGTAVRACVRLGAVALVAVALSGCTAEQLPSYEHARDQTTSVMQRVLDEVPPGSVKEDLTDDEPFACGSVDGVFFTGHWGVYPPAGFDTEGFVENLLGELGPGFEEQDTTAASTVRFRSVEDGVLTTVRAVETDDGPAIDILATSPCAQEPSTLG